MTTDTAERTEEVTEQAPPETPVSSDADLQSTADAAAPTEAPATTEEEAPLPGTADDYVQSVLEKEGGEQAPEAKTEARPSVDPNEVAAKLATFRGNYADRQKRFDAYEAELVQNGMPEGLAKRIVKEAKDILNEHHADALSNAGFEAATTSWNAATQQIFTTIHQILPQGQGQAFNDAIFKTAEAEGRQATIADVIKHAWEMAKKAGETEGYKRGLNKGYTDGRSHGERAAQAGSSGQQVAGSPGRARSGPLTVEEALTLPIDQVKAIRAQENGQ